MVAAEKEIGRVEQPCLLNSVVQPGDEVVNAHQHAPAVPHQVVDVAHQIWRQDGMRRQQIEVVGCQHVEVGRARRGYVERVRNALVPRCRRGREVRAGGPDEDEEGLVALGGLLDEGHAPVAVLRVRIVRRNLRRALVRCGVRRAVGEGVLPRARLPWHGAVAGLLLRVARQRLHRGVHGVGRLHDEGLRKVVAAGRALRFDVCEGLRVVPRVAEPLSLCR